MVDLEVLEFISVHRNEGWSHLVPDEWRLQVVALLLDVVVLENELPARIDRLVDDELALVERKQVVRHGVELGLQRPPERLDDFSDQEFDDGVGVVDGVILSNEGEHI